MWNENKTAFLLFDIIISGNKVDPAERTVTKQQDTEFTEHDRVQSYKAATIRARP
jgi:hypothetical protein